MSEIFDVVVIGSGPGGYAAAIRCAQRGASVSLIEKDLIGGTCLNCGCIPSKALLASTHTLLSIKQASMMGIDVTHASPNWPKMQERKNAIISGFRKGLTGLIQANKIKIFQGRAIVTAPNKIIIQSGASPIQLQTKKIILATGSQPIQLPNIPFDGQTVISSKEALELQHIPKSMVIIGGGVIGCEMACIYAAIGTKVTIVEALSRLIPMEDEWVGRLIEREFKKLSIDTITSQKVASVEKTNWLAKVALENGQTIDAEKVLICVGRRPVVDKETKEALNLQMSDFAIKVNNKMETNIPGVYAIGDAVGTTFLAHGAFAEAEVAAINTTGGNEKIADYSLIPRAVYTFPEIASVGKTEQSCKEQKLDVTIGRAFFKANGRSAAHNQTVGEIRVIKDNSSNKIIGVTMVGAMVTELVPAAAILIANRQSEIENWKSSFPHPTVSEILKEAAEDAFALSIHNLPKA